MKRSYIFVFVIALFISLVCHSAEMKHVIVVDSSGSMSGFYNTGAIKMLVINLQKILGGADIYLFSDKGPQQVGKADALASINRDTRLDLAIEGFLNKPNRPDAIWLITDNVQDRTETPFVDANTKEFYEILRQDDFQKILIMPCFLDFNGKVYINQAGRQFSVNYIGEKGLVIYAILMNNEVKIPSKKKEIKSDEDIRKKHFDSLAERFANTLTAYESKLLLAKPLDKATFDLQPVEQISSKEKPNVTLTNKGIFYGKGFKEGKKIPIVFYVKLLSKFDDLIVSGKVDVSVVGNKFTSIGFRDTKVMCQIYPEKVNVHPRKTTETIYKITINLNKVKIKLDPMSIMRAAFSQKPGTIEGIVRLDIQVPREGFKFTDEVLNYYNTDDIKDYKRIYGMGSIINYMPTDITSIPIEYKMVLSVSYPHWPLILVIALALVLVFIIYLIYKLISAIGNAKYVVSIDGQDERFISLVPLFGVFSIKSADKFYGTITKSLSGTIFVNAKKGFLIDGNLKKKRLSDEIEAFRISDYEDKDNVNVNFRILKKQEKIESKGSDLDEGFN